MKIQTKQKKGKKINTKFSKFIDSTLEANKELFNLVQSELIDDYFIHRDIGAGGDRSSGIDLAAEEIFIKHLSRYGQIVSEECGVIGEGKYRIVIDPIDGSDNFLSKLPYFGTSIALEDENEVQVGVVANLANGDLFLKTKDSFQKTKLYDLKFEEVIKHKFATIGIFERAYKSFIYADRLKKANIKYRAPGALALSLAYAHNVNFLIYEGEMREFDVKAGLFMCEDLYMHIENDIVLIAKDLDIFENLKKILLGD